jgi:hypothetical protein
MSYHGILVDTSLEDTSLLGSVTTLAMKTVTSGSSPWCLRLIDIEDQQLDHFLSLASDIIKPGWYLHCYNNHELIVVYKNKVLRFDLLDRSRWQQAISYGRGLGIPTEQLDFWPYQIKQEQTWLAT